MNVLFLLNHKFHTETNFKIFMSCTLEEKKRALPQDFQCPWLKTIPVMKVKNINIPSGLINVTKFYICYMSLTYFTAATSYSFILPSNLIEKMLCPEGSINSQESYDTKVSFLSLTAVLPVSIYL